jgi:folylpolyglutamate synthase/dihydropteroate synthase
MSLYSAGLRKLYSENLFLRVKQGLLNTERLMEGLQSPHLAVPVVHVAGTNGKGSTCWKLYSAFQALGLRPGLFTSPHIASFRERIRFENDTLIDEDAVVQGLARIDEVAQEHNIPATFFERTTALAMMVYDERDVDVVVLETGLGGRLDATNVVPSPLATVLTTVGLDHTSVLGNSVEQIAWEKAGIAKRGSPFIAGPQTPQESLRILATLKGAPFYPAPPCWWPISAENDRPDGPKWPPRVVSLSDLQTPHKPLPRLTPQSQQLPSRAIEDAGYDGDNASVVLCALRAIKLHGHGGGEHLPERWRERAQRVTDALDRVELSMSNELVRSALVSRPPCRMDAVAIPTAHWRCQTSRVVPPPLASLCAESATKLEDGPIGGVVLLESGHNPEALETFWESFSARGHLTSPPFVVLATSSDRQPSSMARHVVKHAPVERIVCCEADAMRAQNPKLLAGAIFLEGLKLEGKEAFHHSTVAGLLEKVNGGDVSLCDELERLAKASGMPYPAMFFRERPEEEHLAERSRQKRVDEEAALRRKAGLSAGARLSLGAERCDDAWKSQEVDSLSRVGVRYSQDGAMGRAAVPTRTSSVRAALRFAMSRAEACVRGEEMPVVVVCGSVYCMREAREEIGVNEPRDEIVK